MKILSYSENLNSKFESDFCSLGTLPSQLMMGFLKMLLPKPKEFWVIESEGKILGRIGANVSLVDSSQGHVGFFEVDVKHHQWKEVGQCLLETATNWLKNQSVKKAIGPLNINTWFSYRFRTDGDERKFSWEPNNPKEYVDVWESDGWSLIEDYYSEASDNLAQTVEIQKPFYSKALEAGFKLRPFDGKNLIEKEVPILYSLSMEGFKDNFLFEPIPFEVFKQLYVPIANKMDFSLSCFILNPEGKEVGFMFTFQDGEYAVFKSIAIDPRYRGLSLSNALVYASAKAALDKGLSKLIFALIKRGNRSGSYGKKTTIDWEHEYQLYAKGL